MEDFSPQSSLINKEIPKNSGLNPRKLIVPVIALAIVGLGIFYFSNNQKQEKQESQEQPKNSTNSAKPKSNLCSDKQEFVSTKQGYSACFPKGWTSKELIESNYKVGFDQNQVNESFPGTINITISDKSENVRVSEVSENSSKYEFGKITLDGTRGTQITFNRSSDDPLTAYPKGIETIVPKNGRTYLITLVSKEADYETNKTIYEQFLQDFKFNTEVENPPWSDSRNILIYSPWPNDTVKSPVSISGVGIAFEAVISIRIKDSAGHTLTETSVQAASGVERSKFVGNISFDQPSTKKGTIEVFTRSAKDGEEQDKVTIPVNF